MFYWRAKKVDGLEKRGWQPALNVALKCELLLVRYQTPLHNHSKTTYNPYQTPISEAAPGPHDSLLVRRKQRPSSRSLPEILCLSWSGRETLASALLCPISCSTPAVSCYRQLCVCFPSRQQPLQGFFQLIPYQVSLQYALVHGTLENIWEPWCDFLASTWKKSGGWFGHLEAREETCFC